MYIKEIKSVINVCQPDELAEEFLKLIDMAKEATSRSYAPYSKFCVGAAVLLSDGKMLPGCNQENAAFGVTICAERTALFAAGAQFPDLPIVAIAIAAQNGKGFTEEPVTPCGSCRQAMIETEARSGRKLRILLYGTRCVYLIDGVSNLMPLSFSDEQL